MTYFVGINIANEQGWAIRKSFSFNNDKDGFNILLPTRKGLKPKRQIKIGYDSTSHYNFNLKFFLESNVLDYLEFNPLLVHKFISTRTLRKTKNDKKDSQMIAKYLMSSAETFYTFNPVISEFYWKKRNEGKHYNVALSHVDRKLINETYNSESTESTLNLNL